MIALGGKIDKVPDDKIINLTAIELKARY